MTAAAEEGAAVCVTGAGGYVASWLVKLLLSKGYTVHGTVRGDAAGDVVKYGHLKKLEGAAASSMSGKLKLMKADLLDYESLVGAVAGCDAVFHVASPVPFALISDFSTAQKELLEPAVKGTYNVLKACSETNVKRVIIVSSVAAVYMNPNWPVDKVKDESCWSDDKYCTETNNWYCLSKTIAERDAFQYAQKHGLDVISVCPSLVLGPMLQQTPNSSSSVLISLLKEGSETVQNKTPIVVDVRDVAESLLLAYENPEAEGRYICNAHTLSVQDMVEMLKEMYPHYKYPKSFSKPEGNGIEHKVTSQRLQGLGWSFRPLKETLKDSVESYRQAGLLD
ncbi:unnamed protein product [Cuscuta epithymum]|uniref:NAD-dependent epimerase/dehydratase domain-containing protein n=1 Tax=Cuscuta epithymum TaxID=186058 RepID=A0AAV0DCZ5_9ASTE|nr:unnamed protein product [Cuscuta epithymum]